MSIVAGIAFLIYLILGGVFLLQGSMILGTYSLIVAAVMFLFAVGMFILNRFRLVPVVRIISIVVTVIFFLVLIASIVLAFVIYFVADNFLNGFEFGEGTDGFESGGGLGDIETILQIIDFILQFS